MSRSRFLLLSSVCGALVIGVPADGWRLIAAAQEALALRGSGSFGTTPLLASRGEMPSGDAVILPDTPSASTAPAQRAVQPAPATAAGSAPAQPSTPVARAGAEPLPVGAIRLAPEENEPAFDFDQRGRRLPGVEAIDRGAEDNPYAAVGIRVGTFIVRPTIESGLTATSNADSSSGGKRAIVSETALRLNAVSDWSSHSAEINAFGSLRRSLDGQEVKDSAGGVDAALRLDLGKDYALNFTAGYVARPVSATSPDAIEGAVTQPLRQTLSGSAGIEKTMGKALFALTGSVTRDAYEDARLDCCTLSQKDRNATLYLAELRAGYEVSAALKPFVAGEIGRRIFEQKVDDSGYERSSDRLALRAGVAFDFGEKLSGELSGGLVRESFDDDRLETIAGADFRGNLAWSPMRGTTVALDASTTVETTNAPGESGSLLYSGRLSVERLMRANLTGNASLGLGYRDYVGKDGRDLTFGAELGLTWWLNRYAGLVTRTRYEALRSTLGGRDADTASVFVGLRLQR